jgi:hypothetical protein
MGSLETSLETCGYEEAQLSEGPLSWAGKVRGR